MAESYFDLLRRPEWQRKRLSVMQAADFRCEECDAADRTLNVHHRFYKKNAKPWEYEDSQLVCLCEECHEIRHGVTDEAKMYFGLLPSAEALMALGFIKGLFLRSIAGPGTQDTVKVSVGSYEEACGIADAYCIAGNDGVAAITNASDGEDRVSHAVLHAIRNAQAAGRVA